MVKHPKVNGMLAGQGQWDDQACGSMSMGCLRVKTNGMFKLAAQWDHLGAWQHSGL